MTAPPPAFAVAKVIYLAMITIAVAAVVNRSFFMSCALMFFDILMCDVRCTLTPFCPTQMPIYADRELVKIYDALFGLSVIAVTVNLTWSDQNRRLIEFTVAVLFVGLSALALLKFLDFLHSIWHSLGAQDWLVDEWLFSLLQGEIGTVAIITIMLNLGLAAALRITYLLQR
jgi:hypothetical protein